MVFDAQGKSQKIKVFGELVGMVILIVGIALIGVHEISIYTTRPTESALPWLTDRVNGILSFFSDKNIDRGSSVLYFGTSNTEIDVDPIAIDLHLRKQGLKLNSYNVGVSDFNNSLVLLLARRLHEIQASIHTKKFNTIVVDFSPLSATKHFVNKLKRADDFTLDELQCLLTSDSILWQELWREPNSSAQSWYYKHLLNCKSPAAIVFDFKFKFWVGWNPSEDIGAIQNSVSFKSGELLRQVWQSQKLHPHPNWNPELHGSSFFGYPETKGALESLFAIYQEPLVGQKLIDLKDARMDIYSFDFDDKALNDLVLAMKIFKMSADHVILLYVPDSSRLARSPAASKRLQIAIQSVAEAAEVKSLDYSDRGLFQPDDYFDSFHLNLEGRAKLALAIARDLPVLLNVKTPEGSDLTK